MQKEVENFGCILPFILKIVIFLYFEIRLSHVECRLAAVAFCDFWPFFRFPPMSPVWTPQGLRKGVGGCRGLAGMLGISGCPPLSLFLPVALTVKLGRGGYKSRSKTGSHKLTKWTKCVQTEHQLGCGGGDVRGLYANWSGLMVGGGQFAENKPFIELKLTNGDRICRRHPEW